MMDFRHLLLSRANIGIYDRSQKMRSGERIDPEKWMKNRMELFEKYTAPSVNRQSCKNFAWLIVFDPKTPEKWLNKAMDIGCSHDQVVTLILQGDNFRKTCQEEIKKSPLPERLITSRVDIDDAIHKDYIKEIHSWFRKKQRTGILTFPKGLVWNPEKNKLYHLRYAKNHFLTLIEKKKVRTCLFHRHTAITDIFQTFKNENLSAWLEIIHSDNMANYCRGVKLDPKKLTLKDYGLEHLS